MEMIKLTITAKTKIGSHVEKIKGEDVTVNDYDQCECTVEVPKNPADNVEFYGESRYANLARNHELVLLQNLARATLAESKGKEQSEKDAIAQKAVANFPNCIDPKPKTPGERKLKKADKERAKALEFMENALKKSYDKWPVPVRENFDATYPGSATVA